MSAPTTSRTIAMPTPELPELRAFLVFRDRFPFGSPEELDVIRALDHAAATTAAKRRWPGTQLLVTPATRKRSASSEAYREFIARKRAAHERRERRLERARTNTVLMAFRPTAEQRARIMDGEDIYVSLLTFGEPQQGIIVLVGREDAAAVFNVPVRPLATPNSAAVSSALPAEAP